MRSLVLILLGGGVGLGAGLAWPVPEPDAATLAAATARKPFLRHVAGMFERLLALPPLRAARRRPEAPAPQGQTKTRTSPVDRAKQVQELRDMFQRIEAQIAAVQHTVGPRSAHRMPAKGHFFAKKTDRIQTLWDKLEAEPDPTPGHKKPTAAAHLGWTPRRVYATYGMPDSVGTSKDGMSWTYHTKNSSLWFEFSHGLVTGLFG